jgi:hypothetical protein
LSPLDTILPTRLAVQFPTEAVPRGLESWYLLRGLDEGRRYEVRICWPATVSLALSYYILRQVSTPHVPGLTLSSNPRTSGWKRTRSPASSTHPISYPRWPSTARTSKVTHCKSWTPGQQRLRWPSRCCSCASRLPHLTTLRTAR